MAIVYLYLFLRTKFFEDLSLDYEIFTLLSLTDIFLLSSANLVFDTIWVFTLSLRKES